jgi:hypothetical protein
LALLVEFGPKHPKGKSSACQFPSHKDSISDEALGKKIYLVKNTARKNDNLAKYDLRKNTLAIKYR